MICGGCIGNQVQNEYSKGICEVCRLQDQDKTIKDVLYCEFCKVNICTKCNKRYDKRFFAALKKQFGL